MDLKKFFSKIIENSNEDEDYSLNLHYSKLKMNQQLLERQYEEEQFKKYGIHKKKK